MSPVDPAVPDGPGARSRAEVGPALVTVTDLHKAFGAVRVLDGVDLTVHRGEVLAVIGSSGSGKTTLLRCLNGLETADSGVIEIAGGARVDFGTRPGRREVHALRDRSAMVFQHHHLFPHKTVLQNVIEGPVVVQRRARAEAVRDAEALLDRVGLADKRDVYPVQLSGGQQQRVGIARALALRPQLLLFDEPTSALDPELVGEVLSPILELAHEGWTMVIVTHELQFAREVAHRVAFVDAGRIAEIGPPDQVLRDPQHERTRQFVHRLLHPF